MFRVFPGTVNRLASIYCALRSFFWELMSSQVWRINLGTLVTTASLLKVLFSLKTVVTFEWAGFLFGKASRQM